MYYGIWDHDMKDWIREQPLNGKAMLVFDSREKAEKRACSFFGFDTYYEVVINGWGEVKPLNQTVEEKA